MRAKRHSTKIFGKTLKDDSDMPEMELEKNNRSSGEIVSI